MPGHNVRQVSIEVQHKGERSCACMRASVKAWDRRRCIRCSAATAAEHCGCCRLPTHAAGQHSACQPAPDTWTPGPCPHPGPCQADRHCRPPLRWPPRQRLLLPPRPAAAAAARPPAPPRQPAPAGGPGGRRLPRQPPACPGAVGSQRKPGRSAGWGVRTWPWPWRAPRSGPCAGSLRAREQAGRQPTAADITQAPAPAGSSDCWPSYPTRLTSAGLGDRPGGVYALGLGHGGHSGRGGCTAFARAVCAAVGQGRARTQQDT